MALPVEGAMPDWAKQLPGKANALMATTIFPISLRTA
jgi:hypothetical protein